MANEEITKLAQEIAGMYQDVGVDLRPGVADQWAGAVKMDPAKAQATLHAFREGLKDSNLSGGILVTKWHGFSLSSPGHC